MKAESQSKQLKSNNFPTILNFLYLFSVDVATEFNCLLGYFLRPRQKVQMFVQQKHALVLS